MQNKPLAVIVFEDDGNEAVQTLWEAVEQLQQKGLKVGGLLNKKDGQGGYIGDR